MSKVFIIAEAGVNHNGDMELAKRLIDAAHDAGADAVKFQTFKAENVVSAKAKKAAYQEVNTGNQESQLDMIKKLELGQSEFLELKQYADQVGIQFMSTAFDMESVDFLAGLNMPFYKVPSGEITNLPYLRKIASLDIPIILSTGMSDLGEIEKAVEVFENGHRNRKDIYVLHCNTEYPTPFEDVNMKAMLTIGQAFGVSIGYSDHTLGVEVPVAAVAMGAKMIEKHFTLDRTMDGPDHVASLEPSELKQMVQMIRNVVQIMGDGIKRPSPSERKNKDIARRSIHLSNDVLAGAEIKISDLIMKRPGDGISPMEVDRVVGKKVKSDLEAEHQLDWSDLT